MNSRWKIPATVGLILINIAVFIFTWLQAGSLDGPRWILTLLRTGAQFNPLTLDREWYRLFTHMFLHGGLIHLAVNMYILFFIGYALESRVGTKKIVFIYFVSGLAAALNSLYWNLFTIGIGASGGIFGLLGFALVRNIFFSGKNGKAMVILLVHFAVFVAINILLAESVHADYPAHFGGVITGMIIGAFSFAGGGSVAFSKGRIEYLMMLLLIVLYFLMPRYQVRYFRFFKQVVAAEDSTRHRYKDNLTDDQYMRGYIKNYHHWEDVLARLKSQTDLPPELGTDTFKLRKYIHLRRQENMFKKLVVQREAYVYLDSVDHLHELMKPYLDLNYGLWSRIKLELPPDSTSLSKMVKVYYDSNWVEVPGPAAPYFRVGYRDSLGRWDGAVRGYYANGDIQMKGFYSRNKRHGIFLNYSDHGTYVSSGRYLDDRPMGKWETFHDNGRLEAEIFHNNGEFLQNLWDSLGNQLVVDGNGKEIRRYPNGVIAVEGEYRHGVKEGYWYGRHPSGEMYFEEIYNAGRLVNGKSRTFAGETFVYDASSLLPMPEGGFEKFYKYVKAEAEKVDDDIMGHVKVSFRVTKRGTLTDVAVAQSAGDPFLDTKAKEILSNGAHWLPAKKHGHDPTDGWGVVQIEFY